MTSHDETGQADCVTVDLRRPGRVLARAVLGLASLGAVTIHAAGCGNEDTSVSPLPGDPALVGTWEYTSWATDNTGVRRCRFVAWVLHFAANQTLQDSLFVIALDDPAFTNDDPDDTCSPDLLSATMRSWSVLSTGELQITPGFSLISDLDPVAYQYDITDSELTIGFASWKRRE